MKFFVKFNNSNKTLVVYPPKKKGHNLFNIDLTKLKNKELVLLYDTLCPIIEMEFTSYTDLYVYLCYRGIFSVR